MLYIRPATEADFQGCDIEYDYGCYMSDEVKALIEQNNFHGAMQMFRQQTHRGMAELGPHCKKYQMYVRAKRDFESGKPVFVSY